MVSSKIVTFIGLPIWEGRISRVRISEEEKGGSILEKDD